MIFPPQTNFSYISRKQAVIFGCATGFLNKNHHPRMRIFTGFSEKLPFFGQLSFFLLP